MEGVGENKACGRSNLEKIDHLEKLGADGSSLFFMVFCLLFVKENMPLSCCFL
jgi:hypothetical protein